MTVFKESPPPKTSDLDYTDLYLTTVFFPRECFQVYLLKVGDVCTSKHASGEPDLLHRKYYWILSSKLLVADFGAQPMPHLSLGLNEAQT